MIENENHALAQDLVLEFELDASPERVWRAVSIPAFREQWLPNSDLRDSEPVAAELGKEVHYTMRETEPPFLESLVKFQVVPNRNVGTILRIVHALADARLVPSIPPAANSNAPWQMRAA